MKVHINNEAASIVYGTQIERFNSKSINVNSAALLLLLLLLLFFPSRSSACLQKLSFSLLPRVDDKMRPVQSRQLLLYRITCTLAVV